MTMNTNDPNRPVTQEDLRKHQRKIAAVAAGTAIVTTLIIQWWKGRR